MTPRVGDPRSIVDTDDIVRLIMTQHWDMAACHCWVCDAGRALGCRPTSHYLDWRKMGYDEVRVPQGVGEVPAWKRGP